MLDVAALQDSSLQSGIRAKIAKMTQEGGNELNLIAGLPSFLLVRY